MSEDLDDVRVILVMVTCGIDVDFVCLLGMVLYQSLGLVPDDTIYQRVQQVGVPFYVAG